MSAANIAPNAALWKFGPTMTDETFLTVARLFVANVVIGSETDRAETDMAEHLARKYLSTRNIPMPPLKFIPLFSIPESSNNTLALGEDKSLYVCPHPGRGDLRDDLRLALVIECINARLQELGVAAHITSLERFAIGR